MSLKRTVSTLVVLSTVFLVDFESATNNSCKRFRDYYFLPFSKNCYYNPDVFSNIPDILLRNIGIYENHTVTTEDGYILTLFRLPKFNPKGIIILQHPVTSDSIVYILQNVKSLARLMFDAGYEVWLPNNRGTFFSEKHVNLTVSNFSYWDFSFHEIGIYDYSSIINYIKQQTGRSDLIFIGHSMSTTSSLIYASLKPNEAQNSVKIFIEMSPTAYLRNMESPIRHLAPLEPILKEVFNFFKIGDMFRYHSYEDYLSKSLVFIPFKTIFIILLQTTMGWTSHEFDAELFNVCVSVLPKAFSLKIIYHYAQLINSGRFQMFDYGKDKNLKLYKSLCPPEYPLQNIKVPIYLVTSSSDYISTEKDSEILYNKLPDEVKKYGKLNISGLNHADFHFGRSRVNKLFKPLLSLINGIM